MRVRYLPDMRRPFERMFFSATPLVEYGADMLGMGLSNLIAAMIASGGPDRLDARDHRRLHEVLVELGREFPCNKLLPPLDGIPDPEVGRRVRGVTRALWDMTAIGALTIYESGSTAEYRAEPGRIKELGEDVELLPEAIRNAIYRRAADWSKAVETDLKNTRHEPRSADCTLAV